MSRLSLGFEISSTVCTGTEGSHQNYLRYYYAPFGSEFLESRNVLLDHIPDSAGETIAFADKHLTDNHPSYPREGLLVAAAAVLRLCMDHEHPKIEVRDRVIAVPESYQTYPLEVLGKSIVEDDVAEGKGVVRRVEWPYPNYRGTGTTSWWCTAFYLPRDSFSGVQAQHQAVKSDRGGASKPVLFGLLGGETVVEVPTKKHLGSYSEPVRENSWGR